MVNFTTLENVANFGRCVKISNGVIDAVVTVDVGPRIIHFGFCNGQNMMYQDIDRDVSWFGEEYDAFYYKGAVSYLYGGHRIWFTPERKPQTTYPDNSKVSVEYTANGAIFTPSAQTENGVQLALELKMHESDAVMEVSNRVTNISESELEFAVWSVSVMNTGGTELIRHSDKDTGLLHNRVIALWSYTDASDERFYNGKRYMSFKQLPSISEAFKAGTNNRDGKVLYVLGNDVFRKEYTPTHDIEPYPDGGVSFETYINENYIELEVLGPVRKVAAGQAGVLDEVWSLKKCGGAPDARDEAALDSFWSEMWK